MEVKLTEKEVELFELLLASLKHKGASTTIRYDAFVATTVWTMQPKC